MLEGGAGNDFTGGPFGENDGEVVYSHDEGEGERMAFVVRGLRVDALVEME